MRDRSSSLIIFFLLLSHFLVYAKDDKKSKSDSTTTFINSIPEGARVFFNDMPVGTTPLTLSHIPEGAYKVKMLMEGLREWMHTVYIYNGIVNEVTAILDGNYGILDFYSEPLGADVYIDSSLIGATPIKNMKLKEGTYKITIRKSGYEDYSVIYRVTPRYFYLFPKMKSLTSLLSVNEPAAGLKIRLDGKELNRDSLESRVITKGEHEIEFSGSGLKRNFSKELNLDPEYSYRVELKKSFDPVYYSAVIPGTGQLRNGSYIKGVSIFTAALASGIFALSSISNYNDKVEAANYASRAYNTSASELQAAYYRELVKTRYADADKALTYKRIAIGTFIGIYVFNLLDMLLFESNDDIRVYSELIKVNTDTGMSRSGQSYNLEFRMPLR